MRIDIHGHTKKTKSGDSEKRNLDSDKFDNIIRSTDVKIFAITNHNYFDYTQYEEFKKKVEDVCIVWPGVELDIVQEGRRGHLLVIVNPKNVRKFDEILMELLMNNNADDFNISVKETVEKFDDLDVIYIPHYFAKKPALNDEDINELRKLVKNENRVIKEATNSISVGIYISHGHKSIYGSDIQDWDNYTNVARDLPELRLRVESFEQFCLLLDKDEPTINTILDQKKQEEIVIYPFGKEEDIKVTIFNDINILFGSKGTGKTEILKAIEKYYNDRGNNIRVYQSSEETLEETFDIRGKTLEVKLPDIGVESCKEEIKFLKVVEEVSITNLSRYKNYYSTQVTNKRAKSIKVSDFPIDDSKELNRKLGKINDLHEQLLAFELIIDTNEILKEIVSEDTLNQMRQLLKNIVLEVKRVNNEAFVKTKVVELYNSFVELFTNEIAKKTGNPSKPNATGFIDYARNRIRIERTLKKILRNINKPVFESRVQIGNLGQKGNLDCVTRLKIQDGSVTDAKCSFVNGGNKNPKKDFANIIKVIYRHVYEEDLFVKLTELSSLKGIEEINGIDDLILFHKYFAIKDLLYKPSNGEASMLLLHKELMEEKDIYLLDEPEKSLGNDYISEIIVPILKEKAKMGKKVIIATHDANIAVRTLPYNSIYREHENEKYSTFTGNPFSNYLLDIKDNSRQLEWKSVSMRTLEGGEEAFGERGKIYGSSS